MFERIGQTFNRTMFEGVIRTPQYSPRPSQALPNPQALRDLRNPTNQFLPSCTFPAEQYRTAVPSTGSQPALSLTSANELPMGHVTGQSLTGQSLTGQSIGGATAICACPSIPNQSQFPIGQSPGEITNPGQHIGELLTEAIRTVFSVVFQQLINAVGTLFGTSDSTLSQELSLQSSAPELLGADPGFTRIFGGDGTEQTSISSEQPKDDSILDSLGSVASSLWNGIGGLGGVLAIPAGIGLLGRVAKGAGGFILGGVKKLGGLLGF